MSAQTLELRRGAATDDEARDRFVREHERGTFFHLSGWRRVIERVMGHVGCDLVAEQHSLRRHRQPEATGDLIPWRDPSALKSRA